MEYLAVAHGPHEITVVPVWGIPLVPLKAETTNSGRILLWPALNLIRDLTETLTTDLRLNIYETKRSLELVGKGDH